MPSEYSQIEERLNAVEERIAAALQRSGRARPEITLVAVSKKFSATAIRAAYQAGIRNFGENYVQEFAEKRLELVDLIDARFHLIGHLQSNKARSACQLFDTIHTADSIKLLWRLDASANELGRKLEVLLEVKLSGEATKSGAAEEEIPGLLEVAAKCQNLDVPGLMVIPPWTENAEDSRPYFRRLAELARRYRLSALSMGMSNDFEVAIEEGASIVRVGTAIFGKRPPVSRPASSG